MKKFKYTAYNLDHKKYTGFYFANDEQHLRTLLSQQQLFLISCKEVSDKSPSAFFSLSGKVKMKEITYFCRQLAIMINSSIELINCLEILKNQVFSKYFKQILERVYEDVQTGMLLSEAMSKHKKVFPEFLRNMVYVGEMSSSLEKVLDNIAEYYESEMRTKSKIKSALVYPITLAVLTVAILALMMILVVPTFRNSLGSMEIEMPALTMAIFNISDFVTQNFLTLFGGIIGFIVLIKLLGKTNSGRLFFDTLAMKISFTKRYQVAKTTSIFARSFGLLLASGMHIVDAMEVVQKILGNKYIEKKFEQATEAVRGGVSLTKAIEDMQVFPPMLLQMVSVGEKTASLDDSLLRTSGYFDEELSHALSSMMSLIQPVLMSVMGISIGVIFLAVYSPMLSIMGNI